MTSFNGLMALLFAVVYVALGRLVEKYFTDEKRATVLFYLTGLTFVILVIPMQFGREWLSLGWLAQGVVLAAYGILAGEKGYKKAGYIIGVLCLAAFIFFDVPFSAHYLFPYKYLAVTLGSVILLACLAYKKSLSLKLENAYKYAVLINLWLYSQYLIGLLSKLMQKQLVNTVYDSYFLSYALAITVTFIIAFLLPYIPVINDKGTKILSVCLSIFGMLSLMVNTGTYNITNTAYTEYPFIQMAVATIVLILLGVLAIISMRNILMFFVLEARLPVEWLPFGISSYFLILLTQNLVSQYRLSLTSIAISVIYVVAALAWITYGFMKRFVFMRRFGLGLSIVAVAKLFLIDLDGLSQGYKIISYFAFGAALLGISFVYQYFNKRLMIKGVGDGYAEKDTI